MPLFVFHSNEDGSISHTTKDGDILVEPVTLVHPNQIIRTYFQSASRALVEHDAVEGDEKVQVGVQGFLASLFGLEAFLNVFFLVAAREHGNATLESAIESDNLQVTSKLKNWPQQIYGAYIQNQKEVGKRLTSLYKLRNELVHPHMEWSTLWMSGVMLEGVVENPQRPLADRAFCQQAFELTLLAVLRVGLLASPQQAAQFCAQWTGVHAIESELSARLEL